MLILLPRSASRNTTHTPVFPLIVLLITCGRLIGAALLALYLPQCDDSNLATRLRGALDRYYEFVITKLQDGNGDVFNDTSSRDTHRLYNFPWVARLHLAMYQADPQPRYLDGYIHTLRQFYVRSGREFYPIGVPIRDGLAVLEKAGRHDERRTAKAISDHADRLIAIGHNIPAHEVNYEQSIIGPVCDILVQTHIATGEQRYLDALNAFLPALLAFNGQQPDHHLHDIAIRHWDGYWFGKRELYGDTFPHYWSTISAMVLAHLDQVKSEPTDRCRERALAIAANNFSLFTPDGRASAAYLYPLSINDQPGEFADPWANDQDWVLVIIC